MKIGLHMLALQAPGSRGRGIGRYARGLATALNGEGAEVLAYAVEGEPTDELAGLPEASLRTIGRPGRPLATEVERLLLRNPDGLDWWVELSPFELYRGFRPPRGSASRPRRAAVVYDLIPFRLPHLDRNDPPYARRLLPNILALATYDALLCISGSTRKDLIELSGIDPGRARVIGGAADPRFTPAGPGPIPRREREALARLGIDAPFVLAIGGRDPHKNLGALIDAFARVDRPTRAGHRLVIAGDLGPDIAASLLRRAEGQGIEGFIRLAGRVSDDEAVTLYRRCRAYLSASLYEGLGLPSLEAMACGAYPIVAGNSAQAEVVGGVGDVVPSADPAAFADVLGRRLGQGGPSRAEMDAVLDHSGSFSWGHVARAALDALRELGNAPVRPGRSARRPRLAMVGPLPPHPSGVADHAEALSQVLVDGATVERFFIGPGVAGAHLRADGPASFPARMLARRGRCVPFDAAVFHFGNSHHYHPTFRLLAGHEGPPAVVVLHDPCLAGYRHWLGRQSTEESARLAADLRAEGGPDLLPLAHADDPDPFVDACAARGLTLNRLPLERANAIVVHSRFARERLVPGDLRERVHVVPLLSRPMPETTPEDRAQARAYFGIDPDAPVLLAAGAVHPSRLLEPVVRAFAKVYEAEPRSVFLLVGEEHDGGALRSTIRRLGVEGAVRFAGRVDPRRYAEALGIADLAVCLRRPPTRGESSAALLDLLAAGVPTLTLAVDAFAEIPPDVALALTWGGEEALERDLTTVLLERMAREDLRAAMSARALAFARDEHGTAAVLGRYRAVLREVQRSCV